MTSAPPATSSSTDSPPDASVIIPVYDGVAFMPTCLAALARQNVGTATFEVLVVDNGRNPGLPGAWPGLDLKVLREGTRGSYAARNAALPHARGRVLAFTDADCEPEPDWIREGLRALQPGTDLAGGRVAFRLSARPSAAERFDAVTNMQVERNVRERGVAKTANLFVRRRVFDAVGPFDASLRSGGDVEWTRRATQAGFRLAYAPEAVVQHPARRLGDLLAKQARVGRGQGNLWRGEGLGRLQAVTRAARQAAPIPPHAIRGLLQEREPEPRGVWRVWAAGVAVRAATTLGRLAGALRTQPKVGPQARTQGTGSRVNQGGGPGSEGGPR